MLQVLHSRGVGKSHGGEARCQGCQGCVLLTAKPRTLDQGSATVELSNQHRECELCCEAAEGHAKTQSTERKAAPPRQHGASPP